MSEKIYDLIIIGSGPAGMTAGIYARRANIEVLVLEAGAPGGKMVKTAEIENWPGITKTTGPELAFQMFEHMTNFEAVYQYGVVTKIIPGDIHEIVCEDQSYKTKAILIATGTNERKMEVPGEDKFANRGVSYCAICDGAFFKDKVVTVVGGGNSALEEAIYLTKFASKVNILIRRDVFRADKSVRDQVYSNEKINVVTLSVPVEVIGDSSVTGLKIKNVNTNEESILETSGIFPFIGLDPATSFVQDIGICDEYGYIIVNEKMETKYPGIYSAGDVNQKKLRQIVTATSDGAIAAQEISHYLDAHK